MFAVYILFCYNPVQLLASYMDYPFIKAFKYINFFVLYVLTFVILYVKQVEFISLIILFFVNTITHIFLAVDLLNSPKQSDIVIFVLLCAVALMFIAGVFLMIFTVKIMTFFRKNNMSINLDLLDTSDTKLRKLLDDTKIIYITSAMLIGVVAFFLFTSYRITNDGSINTVFSKYFELNWKLTGSLFVFHIIGLGFKTIFAMAVLGLPAYLVYSCHTLSRKGNFKYVTEEVNKSKSGMNKLDEITKNTQDRLFPQQKPAKPLTNPLIQFFKNLNLNYVSEYKIDMRYDRE